MNLKDWKQELVKIENGYIKIPFLFAKDMAINEYVKAKYDDKKKTITIEV